MAGYIGSKSSVTQVDGYTEAEADAEFVTKTGDTMTGALEIQGDHGDILKVKSSGSGGSEFALRVDGNEISFKADADNDENDTVMTFDTDGSERMRIDTLGNVGIGTSSPSKDLEVVSGTTTTTIKVKGTAADGYRHGYELENSHTGGTTYSMFTTNSSDGLFGGGKFAIANADIDSITAANTRLVIDSSGNVFVARTAEGDSNVGHTFRADGFSQTTRSGGLVADFNRLSTHGDILRFQKFGSSVGNISSDNASNLQINSQGGTFAIKTINTERYSFDNEQIYPWNNGECNLGLSYRRFDVVYAATGSINTSDQTQKQDIESLTATEMLVGKRLSALFKTFRWKNRVAEKGDSARTHTGIMAQEVQAAFTAEGLDASNYALFCSDTWWEHDVEVPAVEAVAEVTDEDGNVTTEAVEAVDAYTRTDEYKTEDEAPEGATSKTLLGIRYPELLSFVAAYNEQRFASIEARLTALEA